ncbi:MAG: hypothetical protein WA359_03295 [Acidimicrobiales bacterium]
MFSPRDRDSLREVLLSLAHNDVRLSGVAITGSAALDLEDRWSDIDLAFGVTDENEVSQVVSDWTALMYENHGAVHHADVSSGDVLFRVFILKSTLQVDLSFSPARSFGAVAPSFRLVFGTSQELPQSPWPTSNELIGFGWLFALHARSSIGRKRFWQAEYMISGFRDQALALACNRYGLSPNQGRGFDKLPAAISERFVGALVCSLDDAELRRAYRLCGEVFLAELSLVDSDLANRLDGPLKELILS